MNSTDAVENSKPALRVAATARRNALSTDERARASQAIAAHVQPIVAAVRPRIVAVYLPIRTEVDPRPILDEARAGGLTIALPAVVDPKTMVFRRYRPGEPMMVGGFGTLAPTSDAPVVVPDLIILPMVAFDRTGTRLGHGAGFYDRALAAIAPRPPLLGLAFSVQEVDRIPHEAHDIRLDWIVTERETLDLRRTAV